MFLRWWLRGSDGGADESAHDGGADESAHDGVAVLDANALADHKCAIGVADRVSGADGSAEQRAKRGSKLRANARADDGRAEPRADDGGTVRASDGSTESGTIDGRALGIAIVGSRATHENADARAFDRKAVDRGSVDGEAVPGADGRAHQDPEPGTLDPPRPRAYVFPYSAPEPAPVAGTLSAADATSHRPPEPAPPAPVAGTLFPADATSDSPPEPAPVAGTLFHADATSDSSPEPAPVAGTLFPADATSDSSSEPAPDAVPNFPTFAVPEFATIFPPEFAALAAPEPRAISESVARADLRADVGTDSNAVGRPDRVLVLGGAVVIVAAVGAFCCCLVLAAACKLPPIARKRRSFIESTQVARRLEEGGSSSNIPTTTTTTRPSAAAIPLVDDEEFADWDYADEEGDSGAGEEEEKKTHCVESYVQRRRGRVVRIAPSGTAKVSWVEGDAYAHALVRRLARPARGVDDSSPPRGGLYPGETLELVPAVEGYDVDAEDADLRSAVERADVWPFRRRHEAVEAALLKLRIPHAFGRVELKIRRSDCYAGAFKAYKKLSARAWRMGWFVKFHGEEGLDAGGLSREFWRLVMGRAFSDDFGLFRRSDSGDGTYDVVDAHDDEIVPRLPEYRFVGRCLAKMLFDRHGGCLEAALNVKILKLLVGEPIVFDDLQLVDEALWLSLTKLEALATQGDNIHDLAIPFSVDRVSRHSGRLRQVDLCERGSEIVVTVDNLDQFLEMRMREAVFNAHNPQLLAILAGFHDVVPPSSMLLLTARELELSLCGTPVLDLDDWRQNTNYHGAFEESRETHPVVAAFWHTLAAWDDEKRTRLLQWSCGMGRLPVGGFSNLQQRDGVQRNFTLTSVDRHSALYPRSHTCFNRIDLPLYAHPDSELPPALDFVVTHATADFTLD
ncbi:hypothetical protein CTAYLR_000889 [Chrysophaeum taylorii]|uniref:HECT-type E3 ubiquitin transferase n=1 Tax=Chrysophaeum taylorii TaxID=2483200 RepID=A0AAD7UGQ5_9STRA|nr:hypothetical protein CTAYLR_000889 [Chrysophaeum taylorii]